MNSFRDIKLVYDFIINIFIITNLYTFFIAVSSADKSATAGEDYVTLSGSASFMGTNNDNMASVTLTISPDVDVEGTEQLEVSITTITGTGNNVKGELAKAIVNILDDDTPSEWARSLCSIDYFLYLFETYQSMQIKLRH